MTTLTHPATPSSTDRSPSRGLLAGRVLTGLVVAFFGFDVVGKIFRMQPSVEGTADLGFADHHVVLIGVLLAIGVVLHLVPRTALVGAAWITAYLGGAVAAHVRVDNVVSVFFTAAFGVALWIGYALRDPRVRGLALGR